MNLSFSGCGFLGIYHVGVASCFKEHAPGLGTEKISGTSAGAIAACCFLCDVCLGQCTSWVLRLAAKARARSLGPLHPSFHVVQMLRHGITEILPENAHEICSGRLFVSLTRVSDRKNVIVSQFDSKHDLIQALICSAFVPFYCGLVPPTFRGERYVDGGLSDNLPTLDENTVTVSPFAGETDICPLDDSHNFTHITMANLSIQFTANNIYRLSRALFPPHPEILSQMCKRGFDDALKYLQQNNLINCMRHLSIKSTLTPVYCDDSDDGNDDVDAATTATPVNGAKCRVCDAQRDDKMVIVEDLPPSVIAALQAACDSVNSGALAQIYRIPGFQVLSFMATPMLLPVDIIYNFIIRFLRWLPDLPEDLWHLSREVIELIRHVLHRIEKHRHRYSARYWQQILLEIIHRFTCQVAITEVNYKPQRRSTYADITSEYHNEPVVRNLNIGFAVDFESGLSDEDVPTTQETLRQLEEKLENMDIDSLDIETHGQGQNVHLHAEGRNIVADSLIPCEEIIDTFEECIAASNRRNSVLSYYYNDEDSKKRRRSSVTMTELFSLKQSGAPMLPSVLSDSLDGVSEYSSDTVTEGSDTLRRSLASLEDIPETSMLDLSWDADDVNIVPEMEFREQGRHSGDTSDLVNQSNRFVKNTNSSRCFSRYNSEAGGSECTTENREYERFYDEPSRLSQPSDDDSFTNIDDQLEIVESSLEGYICDFNLYSSDELKTSGGPLTLNSDAESFSDSCVAIPESNSSFSSISSEIDNYFRLSTKVPTVSPLVNIDDFGHTNGNLNTYDDRNGDNYIADNGNGPRDHSNQVINDLSCDASTEMVSTKHPHVT